MVQGLSDFFAELSTKNLIPHKSVTCHPVTSLIVLGVLCKCNYILQLCAHSQQTTTTLVNHDLFSNVSEPVQSNHPWGIAGWCTVRLELCSCSPGQQLCLVCQNHSADNAVICHCLEGRGREGVESLAVQSPRIGVISDLKVENEGEDPGRGGEDSEGWVKQVKMRGTLDEGRGELDERRGGLGAGALSLVSLG